MGNEMGNNNSSGLQEEVDKSSETQIKSLKEGVHKDYSKNHGVLLGEDGDDEKNGLASGDDRKTVPDNPRGDIESSGGDETKVAEIRENAVDEVVLRDGSLNSVILAAQERDFIEKKTELSSCCDSNGLDDPQASKGCVEVNMRNETRNNNLSSLQEEVDKSSKTKVNSPKGSVHTDDSKNHGALTDEGGDETKVETHENSFDEVVGGEGSLNSIILGAQNRDFNEKETELPFSSDSNGLNDPRADVVASKGFGEPNMGNEMGNNNSSGLQEEVDNSSETKVNSPKGSVHTDDLKIHGVLPDEGGDGNKVAETRENAVEEVVCEDGSLNSVIVGAQDRDFNEKETELSSSCDSTGLHDPRADVVASKEYVQADGLTNDVILAPQVNYTEMVSEDSINAADLQDDDMNSNEIEKDSADDVYSHDESTKFEVEDAVNESSDIKPDCVPNEEKHKESTFEEVAWESSNQDELVISGESAFEVNLGLSNDNALTRLDEVVLPDSTLTVLSVEETVCHDEEVLSQESSDVTDRVFDEDNVDETTTTASDSLTDVNSISKHSEAEQETRLTDQPEYKPNVVSEENIENSPDQDHDQDHGHDQELTRCLQETIVDVVAPDFESKRVEFEHDNQDKHVVMSFASVSNIEDGPMSDISTQLDKSSEDEETKVAVDNLLTDILEQSSNPEDGFQADKVEEQCKNSEDEMEEVSKNGRKGDLECGTTRDISNVDEANNDVEHDHLVDMAIDNDEESIHNSENEEGKDFKDGDAIVAVVNIHDGFERKSSEGDAVVAVVNGHDGSERKSRASEGDASVFILDEDVETIPPRLPRKQQTNNIRFISKPEQEIAIDLFRTESSTYKLGNSVKETTFPTNELESDAFLHHLDANKSDDNYEAQESSVGRFSNESNHDNMNIDPQIEKSPSFGLDLRIKAKTETEESDQTILIYQVKVGIDQTMLSQKDESFDNPFAVTEHVVDEKVVALETSDSNKSKFSFLGFLKEEDEARIVVTPEKQQQNRSTPEKVIEEFSNGYGRKVGRKSKEKRKVRSSMFGACMCCATVMN